MNTTRTIFELHDDHKTWLNRLAHYREEIAIMHDCITAIIKRDPSLEDLALVEHFQNQLILQNEQIEFMMHTIRIHESVLLNSVEADPALIDNFRDHPEQRKRIGMFEKLFGDLRQELTDFSLRMNLARSQ